MNFEYLLPFLYFVFGAVVGSFLNVVILRLPKDDKNIVFPASHCPVCESPLRWYENIPIFSYLFLRGRCGHCHGGISFQYPLVEFLTAMFSVGLFYRFGIAEGGVFLGYFLFCSALTVIIWIDIYHQIIPDVISLPGIVAGFCFSFFNPLVIWQDSLIGLICGSLFFLLLSLGYSMIRKKNGLGGGDIKLLAMIGGFLGWQSLFFVIFFSALIGAVVGVGVIFFQSKPGASRIPFGPFLSVAALVYLFFGEYIDYCARLYIEGRLF